MFQEQARYLGRKSSSVAGPRSWNNLPRAIRELDNVSQFRRSVKTHFVHADGFYTMCAMISMEERLININCYVMLCYVVILNPRLPNPFL